MSEIDELSIDQLRARIHSISKLRMQATIQELILGAVSAQGDKKAIKSTIKDIEKALHNLETDN